MAVTLMVASVSPVVFAKSPASHVEYEEVQITAEKMCCKGCAQKVSGQLYTLKGVKSVGVNLSTRIVKVSVPNPSASTLEKIWNAVEQGDGGPTSLRTATADYRLVRPNGDQELRAAQQMGVVQHIVVDNLHCKGCAQKIAAHLYAIKGVTKVSVDMQRETLIVQTSPRTPVCPWLIVGAVSAAKERAVAIRGNYGTLSITYVTEAPTKPFHEAQRTQDGGIQR